VFLLLICGYATDGNAGSKHCYPEQFEKFYPRSERCTPDFLIPNPKKIQYRTAELKDPSRPLTLYVFPTERSAIAGEGRAPSKFVEMIAGCSESWCFVRAGSVIGWLAKERLAGETAVAGASNALSKQVAEPPVSKTVAEIAPSPEPKEGPAKRYYVLQFSETENNNRVESKPKQTDTASLAVTDLQKKPAQAEPTNFTITNIKKKTYSLTGLGDGASLPVRVDHDENSPILGSIPRTAKDVEASGLCVEGWCLVRRGALRGWIKQRHLTDEALARSQKFSFKGSAPWRSLIVHDYPSEKAQVVGQIPSPAISIEPIGDCSGDWCHIRYFDMAGWVRSSELTPQ
jgi:SH3-like domain-containing protein